MISSLCWIPKGVAKQIPEKCELDEAEYERIAGEIGSQVDLAKQGMSKNSETLEQSKQTDDKMDSNDNTAKEETDPLAIYNLDKYDEEESTSRLPVFGKTEGLTYHTNNQEDPYVILPDQNDEEEEFKELEILPTDNLLLACKTEDEVSHLEVYVYEAEQDNLYVHHDIMLPSFPLCAEWISSCADKSDGNFVAIGTFEPEIEIWDLDVIDAIYPSAILGGSSDKKATTRKKRQKANQYKHSGAITALSSNKHQKNLLLSASADHTVKLWDVTQPEKATKSYTHHKDKVCAVEWNPVESTVFLSGGYDSGGRVCALDCRVPDAVSEWKLGCDVECIKWDPHAPHSFYVSTEDGLVRYFDGRQTNSQALFTLHAHDGPVSALDACPHVQGLLVTGGGSDRKAKVWDVRHDNIDDKKCIVSRDLGVGKVFAAKFCMDESRTIAASGSTGKIVLWNLESNAGVGSIFGKSDSTKTSKTEFVKEEVEEESDDDKEEIMEE